MWLKVGIPAVVLLGIVTVRVVYYLFWRKHWDRRPAKTGAGRAEEVVVIRETESHLRPNRGDSARGGQLGPMMGLHEPRARATGD